MNMEDEGFGTPRDPEYDARLAAVNELVERAQDESDEYDGHHGSDRSEESLAYADVHDPATAERIRRKIEMGS